jgi:predicted methyltransferase
LLSRQRERLFPAVRPDHDRVAGPIETVISQAWLGMLRHHHRDLHNMTNAFYRTTSAMLASLTIFGWGVAVARAQDAKAPDYQAIVAAPDRSDADRQTDARRSPAKMLAFTGAKPGMKVLDMEAGAGYSTELLARSVAPGGVVYAQDSAAVMERIKDKFDIRAQNPVMKNTVHVVRNFDDPIPPDVSGLDLITFFFAYHDTTYMPVDRAEMDRKMFAALKPGGFLVIADHSARPGDGATVGKTVHRIEEKTLREEIEAAGFKQVAEADFLRHPEDPRDAPVFHSPVPVDEFVLKFQKPL